MAVAVAAVDAGGTNRSAPTLEPEGGSGMTGVGDAADGDAGAFFALASTDEPEDGATGG